MPTPFQTLHERYARERKKKEKLARETTGCSKPPAEPATAADAETITGTRKETD